MGDEWKADFPIPNSDFLKWITLTEFENVFNPKAWRPRTWRCYMRCRSGIKKEPKARHDSLEEAFRCSSSNEIESGAIGFKHWNKVIEEQVIGGLLLITRRHFISVKVSRGTDFRNMFLCDATQRKSGRSWKFIDFLIKAGGEFKVCNEALSSCFHKTSPELR